MGGTAGFVCFAGSSLWVEQKDLLQNSKFVTTHGRSKHQISSLPKPISAIDVLMFRLAAKREL